jgi:cellulose synthase/poly-beta-1,6-N-acetylglucosamine synthase-like glycosyltransferase
MIPREQDSKIAPAFSVIIPVYNDWTPLEVCLQSLNVQLDPPSFEVIVVDDGSPEDGHPAVDCEGRPYPCSVIRQEHIGIAAARNNGIRSSRGSILLFVDADCRLDRNCLASLNAAISSAPDHDYFQLRLTGDRSNLLGRAEELRLAAFQDLKLQSDSRIRYLNTAGFAIRRSALHGDVLFHPGVSRGEDTLLLADLMQAHKLPRFVPSAVVEHTISLSLLECLRKDLRSVQQESRAYEMIAARGMQIRVRHSERVQLLQAMWKTAKQDSIGRSAWFVVVARQALQRIASFGHQYLRIGSTRFERQT